MSQSETFEKLLADRPSLHGQGSPVQWQLADEVLRWLFANVKAGQRTIETGCGYSTIIFALKGASHTAISPTVEEHQRIRSWCEDHGVDLSATELCLARSEQALPLLLKEPLDIVLIDGWHAFPGPFLDWFFTAEPLKVDGYMVVDDTQLRTVRILREFLEAEEGRWELAERFKRTDIFRKISKDVFIGEWRTQPFGANPYLSVSDRMRITVRPKVVAAIKLAPPLERSLKAIRNKVLQAARRGR